MEAKKNLNGDKQEGVGGPKTRDRKAGEVDMKAGEEGKGGVGGSTPKDQVGTYVCTKATGTCKVSVLN